MTQPFRLVETTPPSAEPVTLDEVKLHLRLDHDDDNSLLQSLIVIARQFCESFTGRAFITRSYSLFMDGFPVSAARGWWDGVRHAADISSADAVILPKPPLSSVTRINVYDANNTATEFAAINYFVDTASLPGRIVLKQGVLMPVPGRVANGIEVQFKAGYGITPSHVPAILRQAMKQMIGHLFEHRGDDVETAFVTSGARALLHPYRMAGL